MLRNKLNRIYAVILRQLYVWTRSLGRFTDTIYWPLVALVLWGFVSLYIKDQGAGVKIVASYLGGYIFWMFLQRSQEETSIGLLEDLWNRNFINIFATPITIWEYLIALIITGILKMAVAFSLIGFVAFILFHFNILSIGIYLIPFIFSLLLTGWSMGFLVNGLILRFGYDVEALGWTVIFLLQPFSGIYYPITVMPHWMQLVSHLIPSSYTFEGLRMLIYNGIFDWNLFWLSLLLNISYVLLTLLFYKKMFDSAKDKGYLVKLF